MFDVETEIIIVTFEPNISNAESYSQLAAETRKFWPRKLEDIRVTSYQYKLT